MCTIQDTSYWIKGSSHEEKEDKCDGNQGFKGGCKGDGRVRGSVKVKGETWWGNKGRNKGYSLEK